MDVDALVRSGLAVERGATSVPRVGGELPTLGVEYGLVRRSARCGCAEESEDCSAGCGCGCSGLSNEAGHGKKPSAVDTGRPKSWSSRLWGIDYTFTAPGEEDVVVLGFGSSGGDFDGGVDARVRVMRDASEAMRRDAPRLPVGLEDVTARWRTPAGIGAAEDGGPTEVRVARPPWGDRWNSTNSGALFSLFWVRPKWPIPIPNPFPWVPPVIPDLPPVDGSYGPPLDCKEPETAVLDAMVESCAKQSTDDGCVPLGIEVSASASFMDGCRYNIICLEDCTQKADTPPETEGGDPDPDPNPTGPYDPGGDVPL
jgi:hypothetical protein